MGLQRYFVRGYVTRQIMAEIPKYKYKGNAYYYCTERTVIEVFRYWRSKSDAVLP